MGCVGFLQECFWVDYYAGDEGVHKNALLD